MNDIEKNTIHPSHYNKEGRKECWIEMEELFGIDSVIHFDILSAYKYLYRAGEKEGNPKEQDIAKIRNYVEHAEEMIAKYISSIKEESRTTGKTVWYGAAKVFYSRKIDKLKYVLEKEGIDIERTNSTDD